MEAENFKRGVVSILLVFAAALSMISVTPIASSGDWVNNPEPGGTTIEVVQGDTFLIRHTLEWSEPENGAYTVTIAWDCYDNEPSENFTFLEASAYFDLDNDNIPDPGHDPILAIVTLSGGGPSPDYPGSARYALSVRCPIDSKDPRNGRFNVDITMSASGVGEVSHIATDNHPILFQVGGIIIAEKYMQFWNRDPINIRVLGRGVSVSISPPENSARPGENLTFTVTVKNTGKLDDNYDLTVSDNAGWAPTLSENLLVVPAGENRQTTLSVTVPANALGCTKDNVTVTAASQADNTISDNASCIAHSVAAAVEVSISPSYQSGLPGETLTYTVTVTNMGNVPDTYMLENTDNAGWTLNIPSTVGPLSPDASENVTLSVTVPGDALGGTTDNVTVTVTSQTDNTVENSASCTAHAVAAPPPPERGVQVLISPEDQSGLPEETITFTVTVKNTGEVEDSYDLTVSDNAGWGAALSKNMLTIPAGENRATTVSVIIPENAIENESTQITVTATSQADSSVSNSGTCTAVAGKKPEPVSGFPVIPVAISAVIAIIACLAVYRIYLTGR